MLTLQSKLRLRDVIAFGALWLATIGLSEVVATSQISIPSPLQVIASFLLAGGAFLLAVFWRRQQFVRAWASPMRVILGVVVLGGMVLLLFAGATFVGRYLS
jgi:hypothetical protein